jgi:hypothetical protein
MMYSPFRLSIACEYSRRLPILERYKIKVIWVRRRRFKCPERLYGEASISMGLSLWRSKHFYGTALIDLDETWSSDGGLCDISRASEGSFAVDYGGNSKTL